MADPRSKGTGLVPLAGMSLRAYPVIQVDELCLSGALSGVSLDVPRAAVCCVLGLGGAGKSALLRVLAGLVRPTSGRALVLGLSPAADRARLLGRAGYLPTERVLERGVRLGRQAGRSALLCGLPRAEAEGRYRWLCGRLGLREMLDLPAEQLPGGARRLAEAALALLTGAELLLLDEPVAGLSAAEREALWLLLRERVAAGVTLVYTAREAAEAERAGTVAVLHQGRLVAAGTPRLPELDETLKRLLGS